MSTRTKIHSLLILFISIIHYNQFLCNAACTEIELKALLSFKSDVIDLSNRLSSWIGNFCCQWDGVGCEHNNMAYVTRIDLRNPDKLDHTSTLGGNISQSLLGLKYLRYLDLSNNNFDGLSIPSFIGSLNELRYLNLSKAGFTGKVSVELGNLSRLRYLDLQSDDFINGLYVEDASWISRLESIRYIDMSGVNFSNSAHWLQAFNMLPYVKEIHLSLCQLRSISPPSMYNLNFIYLELLDLSLNSFDSIILPNFLYALRSLKHIDLRDSGLVGPVSISIQNLTSLQFLDLSGVRMVSIPSTLGNLCNLTTLNIEHALQNDSLTELGQFLNGCAMYSLEELRLSNNGFYDRIPEWVGNLNNLKILDLSTNKLYGPIPSSIGKLSSLELLGLSRNELNESVSDTLGQLSNLITLDLTYNSLNTTMTEAHFGSMKSLKYLDLYNSSLSLNISSNWLPPFQVRYFYTRCVHIGPRFPLWLRNQNSIQYLDMSGAGISDTMPDWFWNITSHMAVLYMSDNEITGKFPKSLNFAKSGSVNIDLSYNKFEGPLPIFPSNINGLYLSTNSFSGSIPLNFGHTMPNLTYFSISSNYFFDLIPSSICELKKLKALDLSKNQLSGEILDCWDNFQNMEYLNLASNKLSGKFPQSVAMLNSLQLLDLSNNNLYGRLPNSVEYVFLDTLDLGQNNFTGSIPSWISNSLQKLRILSLRSNSFAGAIPSELSNLKYLHILDLSNNGLSGNIPEISLNLTGMTRTTDAHGVVYFDDFSWDGLIRKMWVMNKGKYIEYGKLLSLLTVIDLSGNQFSGKIPDTLTVLYGLQSLNLSRNHLSGNISDKIGDLTLLETLDLSRNEFTGQIPSSLSRLNFLSHLNLSYNQLHGKIPIGGQLNTFVDATVYDGNSGLCRFPLNVNCELNNTPQAAPHYFEHYENDVHWYYIGAAPGYAVGVLVFSSVLLLNPRYWYCYFDYIDNVLQQRW